MTAGVHLIMDCKATEHLNDEAYIVRFLMDMVDHIGMHVEGVLARSFYTGEQSGPGVSVNMLLAESHACIHTWPEHQLLTIDVYSCVPFDTAKAEALIECAFGVTHRLRHYVIERWGL